MIFTLSLLAEVPKNIADYSTSTSSQNDSGESRCSSRGSRSASATTETPAQTPAPVAQMLPQAPVSHIQVGASLITDEDEEIINCQNTNWANLIASELMDDDQPEYGQPPPQEARPGQRLPSMVEVDRDEMGQGFDEMAEQLERVEPAAK